MPQSSLELYTSIVPSPRQTAFQEGGFHVFFHYGINTFTNKEWGDGKAPAQLFNPTRQSTDQWMEAVSASGAKGVILTAKHHDGFCLWPTETTEYCVRNSPYRAGHGDVVREVSDSCKKYGLKFGIYLSLWDRNCPLYGTPEYNDFYVRQLTELLTGYGEIFCIWLDGACGAKMDGKEPYPYDFDRVYKTVRELQPDAVISNCGPDIRWVGNESGRARKSEWNVVPVFSCETQNIASHSQQTDAQDMKQQASDSHLEDLGSRAFLANYDSFMWYPAEVDVSIRPGWFYHKKESRRVRSLENLLRIYYGSVGGNSLLLLNVPPDTEGLLHEMDVRRLKELGDEIKKGIQLPALVSNVSAAPHEAGHGPENLLTNEADFYTPTEVAGRYEVIQEFARAQKIDKVLLKEQCAFSQRIEAFRIYVRLNGRERLVYEGTTVGICRFALLPKPLQADGIRLEITQCRGKPYLRQLQAYQVNGRLPRPSWRRRAARL